MKTIKIINLINRIANGTEVPQKIKWEDTIYVYSKYDKDYLEFPISVDEYQGLFCMKDSILTQYLNDEVEIIEDKPKEEIQVLSRWYPPKEDKKIEDKARFQCSRIPSWFDIKEVIRVVNKNFEVHQKALNEIIDKINKEK